MNIFGSESKMNKYNDLKTPCYIFDTVKFRQNIEIFEQEFANQSEGGKPLLGYSVKTNHNIDILKKALLLGMAAEVVSDDEYNLAIQCGYTPDNIIYNGPQKSEELLIQALKNRSIVNLDNFEEITVIGQHIKELDVAVLKIGLRVNFDLEEKCPDETTAGTEVSRFGFCVENGDFEKAVMKLRSMGILVSGVHMHYSSKSRSLNIYRELAHMAGVLVCKHMIEQERVFIDIGGGFFLGMEERTHGKPTIEEYAAVIIGEIKKCVDLAKVDLIIEPGASLLATPISYLTKVINTRDIRNTRIATVDGSILHINPFMVHREPIAECIYMKEQDVTQAEQIICGATCMENDRFVRLKNAKEIRVGDYLRCFNAGAYTMGFNSCFINLPPYIYVLENDEYRLIRDKNNLLMQEI